MNSFGVGKSSSDLRVAEDRQSRVDSLIEVLIGTLIGFALAFAAQHVLFIAYNVPVSNATNAWIVSWMTLLSVVRSYILRRLFNRLKLWRSRW